MYNTRIINDLFVDGMLFALGISFGIVLGLAVGLYANRQIERLVAFLHSTVSGARAK